MTSSVRLMGRLTAAMSLLALTSMAIGQAAPELKVSDEALKGQLRQEDRTAIEQFVKFHAERIVTGPDEKTIVDARKKITESFLLGEQGYQYEFAATAVRHLPAAFDATDALKRLRQANAGLAVVWMPQSSVEVLLQKMVGHGEAVTRYYGWIGYRNIRRQLLAQGKLEFFDRLAERADKEDSPVVIAAMLESLNMGSLDLAGVPPQVAKDAAARCARSLAVFWPRLCKGVLAGQNQMSEAARRCVMAMAYQTSSNRADAAALANGLQSMMDMLWCASVAHDGVVDEAAASEDSQSDAAQQRLAALKNLIQDIEGNLNSLLEKSSRHMRSAVDAGDKPDANAAQLAALKWLDDLKTQNVKMPQYKDEAKPATRPATAASAPASQP